MSSSRVVVTGGLGFIGSRLCSALAASGYEPVAVDDLSGSRAAAAFAPDCETVIAGAEDVSLDGAGALVHLAAIPGVRTNASEGALADLNVALAGRLAAQAAARGMRFVLASTSSVYGNAALQPTPEHAPPRPLNAYARSKVAAEAVCRDAVVARMFTVYGPGQRPDMAFARWIESLEREEPVPWCAPTGAARDFTFVDDAVRGLIAALEHGRPGEAYNIAGPGPVAVRDALAELEHVMGRRAILARVESGVTEARVTVACGRKAEEELGYVPLVRLREGLERQVDASGVFADDVAGRLVVA